ncbi:PREDICTED: uncharacterized protein LOC104809469 [Tarenaya hassleriana]|uniref:uncharacterized protein LOC104809469 n=1 Tax=Tarenaya hassleriana TaxID=28532 RepID=UPI00053C26BF|nr:PREDICTED: uncharacterized protein LOC104809469 [Tarenaya hassleriana]
MTSIPEIIPETPNSSGSVTANSPTLSQTDPYANPLYLHAADSSSLILVSDKLVGESNYNVWSRAVTKALLAKNKLGFVLGTVSKPADAHVDSGSWDRCNALVLTWLTNAVSPEIASLIVYLDDAAKVWKNLEIRFKQKTATKLYNIQHQLDSLHQGALDLNTYFTKLTSLWEELKNHEPFPACTCGNCSCDLGGRWLDLMERRHVVNFLMRLNDSYSPARRQILMIDPLPDLSRAFNLVSQEEQQRLTLPGGSDAAAFHIGSTLQPSRSRPLLPTPQIRPRPTCSHCGMVGHLASKCYKLHGYPPTHRGSSTLGHPPWTPKNSFSGKPRVFNSETPSKHVNMIASPSVTSDVADLAVAAPDPSRSALEQTQSLIAQFITQLQGLRSSLCDSDLAATTSNTQLSPGPYSGLDDWEE